MPAKCPIYLPVVVELRQFCRGRCKLNAPYTARAQSMSMPTSPSATLAYAEEGCKTPGLPISMRWAGNQVHLRAGVDQHLHAVGQRHAIYQIESETGHDIAQVLTATQSATGRRYPGNRNRTSCPISRSSTAWARACRRRILSARPISVLRRQGASRRATLLHEQRYRPPSGGRTADMRMVERMRLLNSETMEAKLTVYDDTVWTQPYVMSTRKYARIRPGHDIGPFSGDPEEYVCGISVTTFDPAATPTWIRIRKTWSKCSTTATSDACEAERIHLLNEIAPEYRQPFRLTAATVRRRGEMKMPMQCRGSRNAKPRRRSAYTRLELTFTGKHA